MTAQADLFPSAARRAAHARTSDPDTSKAAAAHFDMATIRTSQREVLNLYRRLGALDDRAMIRAARDFASTQSDSSLRSRRSELSKPNTERLAEITAELIALGHDAGEGPLTGDELLFVAGEARRRLAIEGYRAPVYDTGRRVMYESGREGVVWDAVENIRADRGD